MSHPYATDANYNSDYGQHTRPFEITPGRNCRLYPYIRSKDCSKPIAQCKSRFLQGMPVHFEYDLSGQGCKGNDCIVQGAVMPSAEPFRARSEHRQVRERFAPASVSIGGEQRHCGPSGLRNKCTDSVYEGGCRCDQGHSAYESGLY